MVTYTNIKTGQRIKSTKNRDGSTTKTVISSNNPITATHSGSKDAAGNNTVDAYNKSIGYSADGKTKIGITTSKDAENRGKAANETLNNISPVTKGKEVTNPLTDLYTRLGKLQADLNAKKEKEAAGMSTTTADTVQASGNADLNTATTAIAGGGTTENIQDPVIRALADKTIANVGIITNQMNTLAQYREQYNEYTQQDIDSIARTAERSVQRQLDENQRVTDAMRFAGVVGGRAQFTPVVEQSIIHEVIQDGMDKIEVINEKKNTAIREARKAEADFNIEAFEQQSELAKEYNSEIESTISAMNAQVRQVEKDERERIDFRQAQEERSSLILAEELIDATPEKIMQTAVANGIDVGLLTKAVNDAKFEKQSQELDIQSKKESILSSQASRANDAARLGLERARFNREGQEKEKSDMPDDVKQGFRSVAQLSNTESEQIWTDIKDFGLNGETVKMWLDSKELTKPQVKAIVSAHEQSQRQEVDGTTQPTATENALHAAVDSWGDSTRGKYGGAVISSPETFFKKN